MFGKKDNLVLLFLLMILTFLDSRGMSFSRWAKCFEKKKTGKAFSLFRVESHHYHLLFSRDLLLCLKSLTCQHNGGKSHSGSKHPSSMCSCLAPEPGVEHHASESMVLRLVFTSWGQESAGDKIPLKVSFRLTWSSS